MFVRLDVDTISFTTPRLKIRSLCLDDVDSFREYIEQGKKQYTKEEVITLLEKTIKEKDTLGIFQNNELVGALVLLNVNHEIELVDSTDKGIGTGYSVKKSERNKGIMSEVVIGFTQYCHSALNLDFVYAYCSKENRASYRVLEKCGFEMYKEDKEHYHFIKKLN